MNISVGKIATLLFLWAFFIGLVGLAATIPTFLLVVGTILYLIG
jgi:hypothetical protein